jgi:glyoxylase-like metal-dependent hydrolase (beta-lactamase superfamily II)
VNKFTFLARVPDEPGSLQRAATVIKKYGGNINRLQFDRRIDPYSVFFEVTATDESYGRITSDLASLGFLQTSLKPMSFLKCYVHLPHWSGSLCEFLDFTTRARANITFIDFDDAGRNPERLTVSLNLENPTEVDRLLDQLKSRYRLEILEYDTTGRHPDDTVFYIRLAQEFRELIGGSEDAFLLSFLADTNHIAQELMNRRNDPRQVFDSVLTTGRTLRKTTGDRFYADVQQIAVTDLVNLLCFQMPCGGSIYVLQSPHEALMIDTGYGIYHADVMRMFARFGLDSEQRFRQIIVTHADADHCGAAGFFPIEILMHPGTLEIIRRNNRAYGSRSEHSLLEAFYTRMINLFSQFRPPQQTRCLLPSGEPPCSIFPTLGTLRIGDLDLTVLEGLGGHTFGQIYLYSDSRGLLFTADSVINFSSLTPERAKYSSLADFLVTSVNVDSDLARKERRALLEIAGRTDRQLSGSGRRCLICSGHGAVSVLEGEKLVSYGDITRYRPDSP